jgi:hypothetical protein
MEYINKIELRGRIGSVKQSLVGQYPSVRFSLCTENCCAQEENILIENTWFQCTAINIPNMEKLEKGAIAHVVGRIKQHGYISSDGVERVMYEVICNTIDVEEK